MWNRLLVLLGLLCCLTVGNAQPVLDRQELRKIPLAEAVVLDPAVNWLLSRWDGRPGYTNQSGLVQENGCARLVVAEADTQAAWQRRTPGIVHVARYPVLALTYRASGLMPSDEPLLLLHFTKGRRATLLSNAEAVSDGTVQEAVVPLHEFSDRGSVFLLELFPHCQGPEAATFEVLGIRFVADGKQPPLALPEAVPHRIRVADTAGSPLVGVRATVDYDVLNLAYSAETDAEGWVTLLARDLPGNDGHKIWLAKEGMAPVDFAVEAGKPFPDTLVMPRGIRYSGIVRNEDGEPVPYAGVQVSTWPFQVAPGYRGRARADVLADAEGRWRTPVLWGEGNPRYCQGSAHPNHSAYYCRNWTWIPETDAAGRSQVELVLRRGVKLSGRVVGPDGGPIAGVSLELLDDWCDNWPERAVTDPAGRFAFAKMARDDRILFVEAEGFPVHALPVYLTPDMGELVVRLSPENLLWGRVVDPGGTPLAGVRIKATRWRHFSKNFWEGTTDVDGQFVWPTAPDGAVALAFDDGEHMRLSGCLLTAKDEMQTVVLPSVIRLHGTVTDAQTGQPVKACTITPGVAYLPTEGGKPAAPHWRDKSSWQVKNGRYEALFGQTEPRQTMALRIQADGYLPKVLDPVAPTGPASVQLDVQLHRGEGLHGVVRLPDGTPAAGAMIYLVEPRRTLWFTETMSESHVPKERIVVADAAGSFRFAASLGRGYLIVGHKGGYLEIDVRQTAAKSDLKLLPWGTVTGTFMVGSKTARHCNVGLSPDLPPADSDRPRIKRFGLGMQTDAKGRFRFDRVPPGPGMLAGPRLHFASYSSGLLISRQVPYSVAAGETIQMVLGGTGRPVTGKLAFPEGVRPAFGWRMGIGRLTDSDSVVYRFEINRDGTFRIEDIPAGRYELRIDFRSLVPGDGSPEHPLLGYVAKTFTIPEMPTGRSDEPLDLGTLVVERKE
jgi:hypothetical protein